MTVCTGHCASSTISSSTSISSSCKLEMQTRTHHKIHILRRHRVAQGRAREKFEAGHPDDSEGPKAYYRHSELSGTTYGVLVAPCPPACSSSAGHIPHLCGGIGVARCLQPIWGYISLLSSNDEVTGFRPHRLLTPCRAMSQGVSRRRSFRQLPWNSSCTRRSHDGPLALRVSNVARPSSKYVRSASCE